MLRTRQALSARDVAERLFPGQRWGLRRVQRMIRAGRLPAERVGQAYLIRIEDLRNAELPRRGRPPVAKT